MIMKIDVDKITADACAHAKIELEKKIKAGIAENKEDVYWTAWQNAALEAIPAAIQIALSHALKDMIRQMEICSLLSSNSDNDRS